MKKQLLSRRGAAIELAIGVMLLMIALSIVLLSLATIKHDRKKGDIAQLESRVELYEVTDYIKAHQEIDYTTGHTTPDGYVITLTDNTYTVKDGENVVLTIVTDGNGNITSWK